MLAPAAIGAGLGLVMTAALWGLGMLRERSGTAVTLVAIAAFYPVFAAAAGNPRALMLHSTVALAFAGLAAVGYRYSARIIAAGLIAHGLFDLVVHAPFAPAWWPAFCAGVDVALGGALLFLISRQKACS